MRIAGEATSDTFEDCIKVAQALKKGDAAAVMALLVKAAAIGLSGIQAEMLLKAITEATGATLKPLREAWAKLQAEEQRKAWSAGAAERARRAEEQEAQRRRERDEERGRRWRLCRKIAESRTLLQDFETAAHNLGVVGEGAGLRALYLACGSRLLADEAVRLLRLGAPASGKNAVVEKNANVYPPGQYRPVQRIQSKGSRLLRRRRPRRAQAQDSLHPRGRDHRRPQRGRERLHNHAEDAHQRRPHRLSDRRCPRRRTAGNP
jgi:hypothetical protein